MKEQTQQKQHQENWGQLSQKIRQKFSKLSTSDVDQLEGHIDELPRRVAKAYGYDEDRARRECQDFLPSQQKRKETEIKKQKH